MSGRRAEDKGHLVVGELLAEADAWAGVEGEEDEGVGGEVFCGAGVEEAVGVEEGGWSGEDWMKWEDLLEMMNVYRLVPRGLCACAWRR